MCESALCPNIWECFSESTATFLILGDRCTRDCGFCAISHSTPMSPDPSEPAEVAEAAHRLGLDYVVLTSVTRDDLPDGGASQFAETIIRIKKRLPDALVEVLIPDLQGDMTSLKIILSAGPDILNHNIETVPSLYHHVRPQADYERSLSLLHSAATSDEGYLITKSGLMLGIGESDDEIMKTLEDLRSVGCSLLTMGQYCQPSATNLPVHRYISPDVFETWRKKALDIGFFEVASGPFARSSYRAREMHWAVTSRR